MPKTKICIKCCEEHPATTEYFYWHNREKKHLRNDCKICRKMARKINYNLNPEKHIKTMKKWQLANPANCVVYSSRWKKKNKDKVNKASRELRFKNIEKYRKIGREREALRLKTPSGNINNRMSCALRHALKSEKNGQRWEHLVGYTCNDLMEHLEKLFKDGMSWQNHGEWHIDHKIPISAFNFTKPEHIDFNRCWSLENLQPMWASENISKGSNLEKPFQPSLPI